LGFALGYQKFSLGWEFFNQLFSYPSGPVEYAGGFISHLFYFSWLGALIITILGWLITVFTANLIRSNSGDKCLISLCYGPALLLLALYNQYLNPSVAALSLLCVLFFTYLYMRISTPCILTRSVVFLVLTALLYYLTSGASLLFVILAGSYTIFTERKPLVGIVYIVLGAAVAGLVGFYLFGQEVREIYLQLSLFYPLIKRTTVDMIPLYFHICIILIVAAAIVFSKAVKRQSDSENDTEPQNTIPAVSKKSHGLQLIMVFILSIIVALATFNGNKKSKCRMIYFDEKQMWAEMIDHCRNIQPDEHDIAANHFINKALFYSGQLAEDMFSYPQRESSLILIPARNLYFLQLISGRVLMELGHLPLAEKEAYEYLELCGDHHSVLKQLVMINIFKEQPETARTYLNILGKDLIHGRKARQLLQMMDKDPGLREHPQIQRLRSIVPTEDWIMVNNLRKNVFIKLLDKNKYNKMAFEYLMAHYLLSKNLDKFVGNLWRMDDFAYPVIPRHYEEAILLYQTLTKKKVDLKGKTIRQQTLKSHRRFFQTIRKYQQDRNAAQKALSSNFGNSYHYYYYFDTSGTGR
jgi:hypothetical protein